MLFRKKNVREKMATRPQTLYGMRIHPSAWQTGLSTTVTVTLDAQPAAAI
jgi:hypothetical protein